MNTRIVIPVQDETGLQVRLAQHFGRAPFYAVVDLDENNKLVDFKTELNRGEHVGGTGHPHEHLLSLQPNIFVVYGMGPGCLRSLQSTGVRVLKAVGNTAEDIIEQFKKGQLSELEGGCEHSHHHNC